MKFLHRTNIGEMEAVYYVIHRDEFRHKFQSGDSGYRLEHRPLD